MSTNGQCSLREAITNANSDAATYPDCTAGSGTDTISFNIGGSDVRVLDSDLSGSGYGGAYALYMIGVGESSLPGGVFISGHARNCAPLPLTIRFSYGTLHLPASCFSF